MQKRKVQSVEYVLEGRDVEVIKEALRYVRHRVEKHPTCGAGYISIKEVERLISEFN